MGLTAKQKRARNASYQARWRAKCDALVRSHPEMAERALLTAAAGSSRLSVAKRIELADRLQEAAMTHLRRSQDLTAMGTKIRAEAKKFHSEN